MFPSSSWIPIWNYFLELAKKSFFDASSELQCNVDEIHRKAQQKKRKEKKKKKTELSWIEFLMLPSFSHDVTSSPPPSNPFFSTAVFIRIFLRRRRRRRRRFFLFFHPFSPID